MPSTGITKSSASPRGHHQAHIACSREESRPRGRALERHVRKGAHGRIVAASFELVDVLACNPGRLRELCSFRRRHRGLRSEEHTSELQSRENLVCRLLLEKKKKKK